MVSTDFTSLKLLGSSITNLFKVFGPAAGAAGIGAGLGVGAAAGGATSQIAMLPFNSANNFIGSAYFGYGMILGERYAYQNDWPKIQKRLEGGEQIENIMQEYAGTFTAMVMKEAQIIFNSLAKGMEALMAAALNGQTQTGASYTPASGDTVGDVKIGATQINIDGEPFFEAGSQQAKDIGKTEFERFKETVGFKTTIQATKPITAKINVQAQKIADRTPTQQKQVPFANGAAIYQRNQLIQKIAAEAVLVKKAQTALNQKSSNAAFNNNNIKRLDSAVTKMGSFQIQLANLLANFNWTRLIK